MKGKGLFWKSLRIVVLGIVPVHFAHGITIIDVVIAYDTAHRDKWGDAGILEEARAGLAFTEEIFANGGMEVDFRIVHIFHDPEFNSYGRAFEHFYSRRFAYTGAFGADLFIFFAKNGGFHETGKATLPGNYCFANLWYFGKGQEHWLLAHEIGHTFGAGHEKGYCEGLEKSSRAYVNENEADQYWTLMAAGGLGNKNRIPCFSSPDFTFDGKVIGAPTHLLDGSTNPDRADNLGTVRDYLAYASNRESQEDCLWKDSVVLPNGYHWVDWFGYIDLTQWPEQVVTGLGRGRNFYHFGLGWCWVPSNSAQDFIWLWSYGYWAWVFVDQALPHCAWVSDGSTGWFSW